MKITGRGVSRLFVVAFAVSAHGASADSFSLTRNGQSYTCTSDSDSGPDCHKQPGHEQCDDPVLAGTDCYYTGSGRPGGKIFRYERSCQSFDGCGVYIRSYQKSSSNIVYGDLSACPK